MPCSRAAAQAVTANSGEQYQRPTSGLEATFLSTLAGFEWQRATPLPNPAIGLGEAQMASVTVVSHLTPEEQASRLQAFAREQGAEIQTADALVICRNLQLHVPTPSNVASRRVQEDLVARGIRVSRTLACEAVARLCGGENWMRVRQQMLALAARQAQEHGVQCYCVHFLREDGVTSDPVLKLSYSELTDVILRRVQDLWPTDVAPALCTVAAGKKAVTLELEHSTAPWLSVRVWSFISSPRHSETDLPPLQELPADGVAAMLEKLERALEYTHPGTLVIGTTRSARLGPDFVFAPVVTFPGTGVRRALTSALDTYFWLGSCENEFSQRPDGSFFIRTSEGEMLLEPRWRSEESGNTADAAMSSQELQAILNRTARLRRVTGLKMVDFLGRHIGGKGGGEPGDSQQLNLEPLLEAMEAKVLTACDLAGRAGLPLNTVLGVLRYGYAQVEDVPKLAGAVGISDPNSLLPKEEVNQLGLRIQSGDSFLRVLKDTHMWRLVYGDGLKGAEEEAVAGIADSLKEYVELIQFEASILKGQVKVDDLRVLEPLDKGRIAGYVQEHLDELDAMGVGVLVARNVRFMRTAGEFAHMNNMPLNQSTVFFEKVSHLQKPTTFA